MVMKLELLKAFAKISWLYLRLIFDANWDKYWSCQLDNGVFSLSFICNIDKWFSFKVLYASRGLRQDFPVSSFIFLPAAGGLSRMTESSKREGSIKGRKMGNDLSLSHLLFVDDAILFWVGTEREAAKYRNHKSTLKSQSNGGECL